MLVYQRVTSIDEELASKRSEVSGWCSRSSRRTSHREIARELSAGEEEDSQLNGCQSGSENGGNLIVA